MTLEELEIVISADLEKFQAQFAKIEPFVNKTMKALGMEVEQGTDRIEKNMDMSSGLAKISKQLEKMHSDFKKQTENMQNASKEVGNTIGKSLSSGFSKARKSVNKDIDALVNDINSKMGQAKAQQEKLAYLKTQRQSASSNGDTKNTVKFDEQIARAEAAMTKYHSQAKAVAKSMSQEFNAVPESLAKIERQMAINEGSIEAYRAKLKSLQSSYDLSLRPTFKNGKNAGYQPTEKSVPIQQNIAKQAEKMQKLINENDALAKAYAYTQDRAGSLKVALAKVSTELSKQARQTETAGSGFRRFGRNTEQSRGLFSRFHDTFQRQSKNISDGTSRMGSRTNMFAMQMRSLIPQLIIYGLLYQGITKLAGGLWDSLKTNQQFSDSLNQIKVNLLTAFYPIYTAILPAINAMMSALATATGYLAQFVATLFGTTYQKAKQGAQGLYSNVQAMKDTGTQADKTKKKVKQLQQSLMGFDEINRIGLVDDKGDDADKGLKTPALDKNAPNFNVPTPLKSAWIDSLAQALKDFFKPFRDAWNAQGKRVMDAWKYALSEVGGLLKAIGKSFMEVWTNGTGQKFIENWLILLADVLYIIGDIARAFKEAWNDGGRGTNLIQQFFNGFNSILELLHSIAQAFREAWNDNGLGRSIAANILDIFTNIFVIVGNLAKGLQRAWETNKNGKQIFQAILGVINIILTHINNMTKATATWARHLDFTPLLNSISRLLQSMEPLTNNIGAGLSWFYSHVLLPLSKFTIEKIVPAFLDALRGAISLTSSIINASRSAFGFLFSGLLNPLSNFAGQGIVVMLRGIGKSLEVVGNFIDRHQEGFSNLILILGSFALAWKVVTLALAAWNIAAGIGATVSTALGAAIAFLTSPIGIAVVAIGTIIAIGVLLWKNWDTVKKKAGELRDGIVKIWSAIKDWTVKLFGKIISFFKKWGVEILAVLSGPIGGTVLLVVKHWDTIKKVTSKAWDTVKKWTSEKWNDVKDSVKKAASNSASWVSDKWNSMKTNTAKTWESIKQKTSDKWSEVKKAVQTAASNTSSWVSDKWGSIKANTSKAWDSVKSRSKDTWSSISNTVGKLANSAKDKVGNAWGTLKSKTSNMGSTIKSTTKKAFDTIVGWSSNLGDRIAKGFKSGLKAIGEAASSIGNKIINIPGKAVNGVLKGVRWVLTKVGAKKMANALDDYPIPNYATGTKSHPGGPALVNDGSGPFREAYKLSNGTMGLFPNRRNLLVDLPQGSQVLDGRNTAKMLGAPKYANGVFESVSDFVGDVWDYMSKPKKLLQKVTSKFVDYGSAVEPTLSIAKGSVSKLISGSVGFVKKAFDSGEGSPEPKGKGVQRWASTVAKALAMNGLPTTKPYVNAWLNQIATESGGNPLAVQGNIGDINNITGDLAKGLVQVIGATFNAYKFPGHGNRLNGLDSLLAGIAYAKSRYGAEGMLGMIGKGHGYENGGRNHNDGYYRLSEGNKEEWIIPMEKPSIAKRMLLDAMAYLDMGFGNLQMPNLSMPTSSFSGSAKGGSNQTGDLPNSLAQAILGALQSIPVDNSGDAAEQNIHITLEVEGDKMANTVIKNVNKKTKQTGQFPFKI